MKIILNSFDLSKDYNVNEYQQKYASTGTSLESRELKRKIFNLQQHEHDNYD